MAGLVLLVPRSERCRDKDVDNDNQISLLHFLISALRKSVISCSFDGSKSFFSASSSSSSAMDIGFPTEVRHVTHVTFDRFHGFLGLPAELQLQIPCRVPSASASVFGVSAKSMQCSYDSKGNSVPTILLLMQEKLYSQGGLKAEGIFRINPENGQEEEVRRQLNKGIVGDNIDVHCLAGLIKAWFRELPCGVLDGISPDQVLQCNSEGEPLGLVKKLQPTEAALLNWAVHLMADIVEEEEHNKMNPRNIAMVFAPNMTHMSDPLTALMHAVQVMNFLNTLITKTLKEREDCSSDGCSPSSSSLSSRLVTVEEGEEGEGSSEQAFSDSRGDSPYRHSGDGGGTVESGNMVIEDGFLRLVLDDECHGFFCRTGEEDGESGASRSSFSSRDGSSSNSSPLFFVEEGGRRYS